MPYGSLIISDTSRHSKYEETLLDYVAAAAIAMATAAIAVAVTVVVLAAPESIISSMAHSPNEIKRNNESREQKKQIKSNNNAMLWLIRSGEPCPQPTHI